METISLNESGASHHFLNFDLLDEFMAYVRADFGIATADTSSDYAPERDHSPIATSQSDGSESLSSSQSQLLIQSRDR